MADPIITTTLVLMYFITPPAKPSGQSKEVQESKAVWTLQSTDHIETQDSTHCVLYAKKLLAAVRPVNTMTLRRIACVLTEMGQELLRASNRQADLRNARSPHPDHPGHRSKHRFA